MQESQQSMVEYYAKRAAEYEKIFQKPERQTDLRQLENSLAAMFEGQDVLEIACGTGYWTQFIATSAKSIVATDYNTEVLDIARQKDYGSCRVTFLQADAYSLSNVQSRFTAGFHAFWWSHIPLQQTAKFIKCFHSKLADGAPVAMLDNSYVPGSSTPISRRDDHGNTYQSRALQDGSQHEVLKNFPSSVEITSILEPFADQISVRQLQYYWICEYQKRN